MYNIRCKLIQGNNGYANVYKILFRYLKHSGDAFGIEHDFNICGGKLIRVN